MHQSLRLKAKTLVVAGLITGVVPFVPVSPAQAHTFTAESNISINREGRRFFGKVASHRSRCKRNRVVTLQKIKKNRVINVGTDRTNRHGNWSIRTGKRGRFRAVVSRRAGGRYGHSHVCRGDRSPTIHKKRRGGGH